MLASNSDYIIIILLHILGHSRSQQLTPIFYVLLSEKVNSIFKSIIVIVITLHILTLCSCLISLLFKGHLGYSNRYFPRDETPTFKKQNTNQTAGPGPGYSWSWPCVGYPGPLCDPWHLLVCVAAMLRKIARFEFRKLLAYRKQLFWFYVVQWEPTGVFDGSSLEMLFPIMKPHNAKLRSIIKIKRYNKATFYVNYLQRIRTRNLSWEMQ